MCRNFIQEKGKEMQNNTVQYRGEWEDTVNSIIVILQYSCETVNMITKQKPCRKQSLRSTLSDGDIAKQLMLS